MEFSARAKRKASARLGLQPLRVEYWHWRRFNVGNSPQSSTLKRR